MDATLVPVVVVNVLVVAVMVAVIIVLVAVVVEIVLAELHIRAAILVLKYVSMSLVSVGVNKDALVVLVPPIVTCSVIQVLAL